MCLLWLCILFLCFSIVSYCVYCGYGFVFCVLLWLCILFSIVVFRLIDTLHLIILLGIKFLKYRQVFIYCVLFYFVFVSFVFYVPFVVMYFVFVFFYCDYRRFRFRNCVSYICSLKLQKTIVVNWS